MLQKKKMGGRLLAGILTTAMLITPLEGLGTLTTVEAAAVYESNVINLESSDTDLYVGTDWAGTNATYTENGSTVTIDVTSYGWNGEWGLQYIVKDLELSDNTDYKVSFTMTSSIDKNIRFKLGNESSCIDETVSLTANTAYNYSKEVSSGTLDEDCLYFGIGQMSGESANLSGTMTISDITIAEVERDTSTGAEYDFSAENNETYDQPASAIEKDGYELIWADEFDGDYGAGANVDEETGLNLDNWAYQLGDGSTDCGNYGWGNNELECYTDSSNNIAVNEDLDGDDEGDGLLRITASYEEDGYTYESESAKSYTSARIRTTDSTDALFTTTYGYVEARMSLPATAGAWPAFWMLPESTDIYGSWPVSGEIDIMETCGAFSSGVNNQACGTLHWGAPSHVYKGSGYVTLDSDYTYFHTYAIDWQPGQITWYYDGEAIYTSENWESAISGASDSLSFDAPFDQPFYLLLNLAVDSGQFGGSVNKAVFEGDINMYVDYVRVYQKEDGYADSVVRTASSDAAEDWEHYAGVNQIADITESNITVADGGDMNSLESNQTSDAGQWYLAYQSDATDATAEAYTDEEGNIWAKVGITTTGSQDYSVQLIGHYDAKANYVYKVSFDAYADGNLVGKTVNCDSKEWSGWSTYGILSFELKDTATSYSYLISQTEDFDDCRIEFNLGAQASGNVYIGNVRVEIVDPESVAAESDNRTALSNGDLIYNGTFDQGNNRIGYWSAGEDTTFEVPRYTTEALTDSDVSVVDIASMTNYEKIEDGVKYYERRAQVSADDGVTPEIYQSGLRMPADSYTLSFDLYSKEDTTVTASICTVTEDGTEIPDTKVISKTMSYDANDGVAEYTWTFMTSEDIENAALVLSFGDGSSVYVDHVSLIGASLAETVDETPLTSESGWEANNGAGGSYSSSGLTESDGVYMLSEVTSNSSAWYCPQIISDDFSLVSGNSYTVSFQYKLSGTSNNTAQYIIQENGGSWIVYNDGPTTFTYDSEAADEDGYCTYTCEFTAGTSLDNVHMVFGLGNSEASNATFSFKNVTITLTSALGSEDDEGDSDDDDVYVIGVRIVTAPTRTNYTEGETFDPADMEVVLVYSDQSTSVVTDYTISPASALTTSDNKITVYYTVDGVTYGASCAITVTEKDTDGNTSSSGSDSDSTNSDDTNSEEISSDDSDSGSTNQSTTVEVGDKAVVNGNTYKITSVASGEKTVAYVSGESGATKVTIPATVTIDGEAYNVTKIAAKAFYKDTVLTEVTIGKNVVTIGKNAFAGCTGLTTVKIGSGVTTIGSKAFCKCTALKKITIPAKVEKIGKKAFYGCAKLKTITIKTTKLTSKKVGSNAFAKINAKATIKVPAKKLASYKKILKKSGISSKVTIIKK